MKPNFEGDANRTFFTSANFLSCRFRFQKVAIVGEIPFAHYGVDNGSSDSGDNALGNPYVGVELWSREDVFFELGGRLPVAPDDDEEGGAAAMVGLFTDFVDRLEAFASDAVPIVAAFNYLYKGQSGLGFRLRGGTSFQIATGEREETEWFVLYGTQIGYWGPVVNFSGGLSGRLWVTEDAGSFGEQTWHQVVLALGFAPGVVQPSVNIRFPLDEDLSDILDWVVGINL
ncbi:MAG: hypothetical protein JSW58_14730, partial [Candidatus Latescibacterota bacterium]